MRTLALAVIALAVSGIATCASAAADPNGPVPPQPAATPSPAATSPASIGRTRSQTAPAAVLPDRAPPQASLDASRLIRLGELRLGDALVTLPGLSGIGQGSSFSDDLFVSLRGAKPTETLTLLDGHPVGVFGIAPDMNAGFNYQNAPLFALQGATVTYGAGPSSLAAFDGLIGSINLQTLAPTAVPQTTFVFATGSQASSASAVQATGTAGAMGYAFVYGVQGTSGNFSPQTIAQTGLRATDFTTATLQALTYSVSANTTVRDGLATLRFPVGSSTAVTLTALSATSWADKTGVDDNDFYPFAFEHYQAQNNLGGALVPGGATCPASLVPVIDDAHPNPAQPQCITADAFAAGASGPAGGGPGAFQTIRRADEDARVVTQIGIHHLTFDGFLGAETTALIRPASYVQGPSDDTATQYTTGGFIARDDVVLGPVTLGAGVSSVRQRARFDDTLGADPGPPSFTIADALLAEGNAFVYAAVAPSPLLTIGANVLVKRFYALGQDAIDPQLSIVVRPTASDALRLIAGGSTQEPAALARGGAPSFTAAGDLDPGNCSTFTIGSAPNPDVTTERSSDVELSYGHRFANAASVGVTAFVTSVRGQIFGAGAPLATIPGFTFASAQLAGFYDRVRSICPGAYGAASDAQIFAALTLEQPINAARALTRGAEFDAALPLAPRLTLSGTYTIDSAQRFDLPASVLSIPSNVAIVDGAQIAGIPVHQGSASLAYVHAAGLSAQIDAIYQGPNNHYNLPGFAYANASLGIAVGHGRRLDVAMQNVFGSHADTYGRVGLGLFQPENPYGTDGSALAQATERYGLVPSTIVVTLTQRVGRTP